LKGKWKNGISCTDTKQILYSFYTKPGAMKILFTALLTLIFISCKKTVDELPPATQIGAHTFGCRIDGTIWGPQKNSLFPGADILEARHLANRDLYINARNFASSPNETEFEIFLKTMNAPGVYNCNTTLSAPSGTASYIYYVKRNITPENEWMTSAAYTGTVTITAYDTVNNFVSGTFQLQAINLYNAPQPLTITEGRFDVRIQ
jgi:hypothetical protein